MPFLARVWAGIVPFVRRCPLWGGLGGVAFASFAVQGVTGLVVLVFAIVYGVHGIARRTAATDALSGYLRTARPPVAEESDGEFRRHAEAMRRSATVTIRAATVSLVAGIWLLRDLSPIPFVLAAVSLPVVVFSDVDALTHQPAVADRLVNALRMRVHVNIVLRRLRRDLTRTDGVLQPPLVATLAAISTLVSLAFSSPALAGIDQIPPGRIVKWVNELTHDHLPKGMTATPSATPSPATTVAVSPTPAAVTPSVSVEDICGPGIRQTFGLPPEGQVPTADDTIRVAMYDAYLHVGATEAGCPIGSPQRSENGLWIAQFAHRGTTTALVVARSVDDAAIVLAPLHTMIGPLLNERPGIDRIEPRERSGTGDYQAIRLRDRTCRVALRREFSDPYTLLEPEVTRAVVDASLARGQFPYVISRQAAGTSVQYVIGFEASGGYTLALNTPSAAGTATCPDLDAFEELARQDRQRHAAVLATVDR